MQTPHCKCHSRFWLCVAVFGLGGLTPDWAAAQTITQNTQLRFGRIVMHNNGAQRDLRLLDSGGYTADAGYYIIDQAPQLGSYTIEDQTPNALMDIVFTPIGNLQPGGGGAFFTLVDFFTVPPLVVTNGDGDATFQVGATLRSSGFGNYSNNTYDGNFSISVTPHP